MINGKMRILIAGQTYYPITNGQAVFTYRLAEGLAQLGHQVLVITPSDRFFASRIERNGVTVQGITAIPLLPLYTEVYVTFLANPQIKQLLDNFKPDIIHVQDHYPLCSSVTRIARRRGIPLIGTNHFLPQNIIPYVPVVSKFKSGRRFLEIILWKLMFKTFNQLDIITTPTETAARILYRHGFHKQIYSISCGIDLNRFQDHNNGNRDRIRQRYGLDPNRVIFLYVGRVDREKRLEVLIEAFHRLNRDDIQLIIAGKGLNLEHLKQLTQQLQLKDRVIFTGYVPQDDLPILLSSADVFSMPSDVELQSIATLEALAVGKPVLAADARALPELVRNGTNGCLFKANDVEDASRCIAWMVDQPNELARMGKASLEIVKNHDINITIKQYLDLYRFAIDRTGHSQN